MASQRDLHEALRYMAVPPQGYEQWEPLARQGFDELAHFAEPRKCSAVFELTLQGHEVYLNGSLLCVSADLARLFAHCSRCVVMAVTLGSAVDRRLAFLQRCFMERALALDACASVAADRLCDDLEGDLESHLVAGEYLTLRFSPGYGDVPMDVTAHLLKLLDAERRLGITLTAGKMMTPLKSVTALAGISNRPEPRERTCADCAMKNCTYRREGGRCAR